MTVQVKIDPTTGLTKCGNSVEKEDSTQCLFSTVWNSGTQGWGLGIPNVLRNAWQLIQFSVRGKNHRFVESAFHPHAYWSVDHRPKGTKQIVDSGVFSFLWGEMKNSSLRDIEEYAEYYIDFVNNHFGKYCKTNNTPWFVELDIQAKFPMDDYRRLQRKLLDSCPNRDFIGVFHPGEGLGMIDELAEKFDYISLGGNAIAKDRTFSYQAMRYIADKYPEKCIHMLGTDSIQNNLVWGNLHRFVDTCDSTGWVAAKRTGLNGCARKDWVAPALKWCNDNWFKFFPKPMPKSEEKRENKDPLSGLSPRNMEGQLWAVCKVWCIWSYFNLYGYQKQWDRGGMRRVMKKILEGRGAELCSDDIDEPLYEFEEGVREICGAPFYIPKGYEHTFDKVEKMNLTL